MTIKIPLKKLPKEKISVSFTWDDNSTRHASIIGPLFLKNGLSCTFYIVPGDKKFEVLYASEYADLNEKGFEISSHSFSHKYMTKLSEQEAEFELLEAVQKIQKLTGCYPLTFAFPNHDYNDKLLNQARKYHLETRNTLVNSIRFSIKTDTSLKDLIQAINDAILSRTNLIFSGHSIITEDEYMSDQNGEGYQPIRSNVLSDLLEYLNKITSKIDVITFSQSVLRETIKKIAVFQNDQWFLDSGNLKLLAKFHIDKDNITSLL